MAVLGADVDLPGRIEQYFTIQFNMSLVRFHNTGDTTKGHACLLYTSEYLNEDFIDQISCAHYNGAVAGTMSFPEKWIIPKVNPRNVPKIPSPDIVPATAPL